ncbi:MAG: hypothetical protein WC867_00800 [Candidatus Pacearchaeota archaeon]|jgi:hypothetical protein
MTNQNEEGLATIKYLADQLGVNLNDERTAIATASESAKVRMYNGSLEAKLIPTSRGAVTIESPRSPGIYIELVDHTKDVLAPVGAIYQITTYMPSKNDSGIQLNGDIYSVYVGKEGLILSQEARIRAANLL